LAEKYLTEHGVHQYRVHISTLCILNASHEYAFLVLK